VSRRPRVLSPLVVAVAVLATVTACSFSSAGQDVPAATPSGPTFLYVAVGASETVGFGSDQPLRDAWPRVFHRTALPQSAQFVNMGIPGATVAQALRDELPSTLTLRPAIVTVWLNVNDVTSRVTPDAYERDLDALVRALRRNGATRVLVANTPPLDHLPAYLACRPSPPPGSPPCRTAADLPGPEPLNRLVDAYNAAVARVTQREGAILVDLHALGLAARQAGTEASLVSGDGFHPSTAGHQAVATAFAAALRASGPLPPGG
jgi:lysophospholipase L1-like esterase